MALAETAKLALARTARNLDADLRKDNAFIVEPSSRDGVAHGTQKGGFEGCFRELQEKDALLFGGSATGLCHVEKLYNFLVNFHPYLHCSDN